MLFAEILGKESREISVGPRVRRVEKKYTFRRTRFCIGTQAHPGQHNLFGGVLLADDGVRRPRAAFVFNNEIVALADVLLAAGWAVLLSLIEKDITVLNDPVNVWLRLLQLIGVLAFIGGIIGLVNFWHVWSDRARGWWARIGAVILAFATMGIAWMVVALRLVTLSLQF
jgi:hypothetical protein